MKRTLIVILSLLVFAVALTSCESFPGGFPSWMQGSWDRKGDNEWIEVSSRKLVLHGDGYSTTYRISSGDNEYETSKEKKFEVYLDPFLSIEATLTKSTGELHILDYKMILTGYYTKR